MTVSPFKPNKILLGLLLPFLGQNMAWADEAKAEADTAKLDTVVVIGKKVTPADKPFKTIGGVSHRGEDTLGEGATSILRGIPGTFTQHDVGQPGIQVNIRGMEGFGRVNTMIDGVQQAGFQSNPAHGSSGTTAYVDENLLVGIDVQRGGVNGADGAGSLGGAVNFRTIGVDDLVQDGRRWGAKALYRFGSNGYGYNNLLSAAFKETAFGGQGSVGAIFAGTQRKTSQYENAAGEENIYQSSNKDAQSELFKIHIRPDEEQSIELSHLVNRSEFENNLTPMKVVNRTNYLKYEYDPMSDWVKVAFNLNYNKMSQFYTDKNTHDRMHGKKTTSPAVGMTLQNTSEWQVGDVDFKWVNGLKLHRVRYESNLAQEQQRDLSHGESLQKSLFTALDWEKGAWSGAFGLAHNRYQLKGNTAACGEYVLVCAQLTGTLGGAQEYTKSHDFNPSVSLAYQATDWLQVYSKWSKTSRSPTIQEVFYPDLHNRPIGMNIFLKPESSENRELGFNVFKNGFLHSDDSLRLKVNYFNNKIKNYIFNEQYYLCDTGLGLPITCGIDDDGLDGAYGLYANAPGTSTIKGFEVEGRYDIGRVYATVSWSKTETNLPRDFMAEFGVGRISDLPETYWDVTLGSRWLNDALVLGTRISHTGHSLAPGGYDFDNQELIDQPLRKNPKLVDLFATYTFGKEAVVTVNVTNVANKQHSHALSRATLGSPMDAGTGSGRTYSLGLSMKF
ncbi:TonB-dependent receptor [Neisseriaceae bacterium CLB008]|nr:TonB-dependent receptor [Neisseriaceae bacterium]